MIDFYNGTVLSNTYFDIEFSIGNGSTVTLGYKPTFV
jgi:hypothetical protein